MYNFRKGAIGALTKALRFVADRVIAAGPLAPPSVVVMTLDFPSDPVVTSLFHTLNTLGVHLVIGAGNKNVAVAQDRAASSSDALIVVGASTPDDQKCSFSNYGPLVTIFGPGADITSASSRHDQVCQITSSHAYLPIDFH